MTIVSALALEDGSVFRGRPFGAPVDASAEVVFNTCMTGYQEISTDPSYRGQMVALTYPLIGVYGASNEASESRRPWISALIVRDYYDDPSNWCAKSSLGAFLSGWGVPAVRDIDTRALTRRLRARGTMRAILVHDVGSKSDRELVEAARTVERLSDKDLVADTSIEANYDWASEVPHRQPHIVVVDCGIKENILRSLGARGARITVVPFDTMAEKIMGFRPDGVVISNGPGDPIRLAGTVAMTRGLLDARVPLLGICLGHQLLGLAAGGRTSRLRFGHHGGNHPVIERRTGRVHITSQNHEFQVDADSIPGDSGFYVSQTNLNDNSVEGLAHDDLPVVSVQYHPEGSPGPQDNQFIFDRFVAACGV